MKSILFAIIISFFAIPIFAASDTTSATIEATADLTPEQRDMAKNAPKPRGALAAFVKILDAYKIKYEVTKREPVKVEIPYSVENFAAWLSASMETRHVFGISGYVIPNPKKYQLTKEKLSEIAEFMNNNLRLSKYTYSVKGNLVEFVFRQIAADGNISDKNLNMLFSMANSEIYSMLLTMRFVLEDNMGVAEARALVDGWNFGKLPLYFSRAVKYEQPELGYSLSFGNKDVSLDEYRYDLGKKWKSDVADKEFAEHFKTLGDALPQMKEYSDVKSLGTSVKTLGGLPFLVETFNLKRRQGEVQSIIYLGVKNGKLLKFRVTYTALDSQKLRDAVDYFISERAKSDF